MSYTNWMKIPESHEHSHHNLSDWLEALCLGLGQQFVSVHALLDNTAFRRSVDHWWHVKVIDCKWNVVGHDEQVLFGFNCPWFLLVDFVVFLEMSVLQFDYVIIHVFIPNFNQSWHFPLLIFPVIVKLLNCYEIVTRRFWLWQRLTINRLENRSKSALTYFFYYLVTLREGLIFVKIGSFCGLILLSLDVLLLFGCLLLVLLLLFSNLLSIIQLDQILSLAVRLLKHEHVLHAVLQSLFIFEVVHSLFVLLQVVGLVCEIGIIIIYLFSLIYRYCNILFEAKRRFLLLILIYNLSRLITSNS